ncbi:MAG: hypothetical protein OEZ30_08220, partial [Candidatus Aminicenantes bacterium]|nr:hypothetical protein [Candidatus Aminicenantes bacterium]
QPILSIIASPYYIFPTAGGGFHAIPLSYDQKLFDSIAFYNIIIRLQFSWLKNARPLREVSL